MRGKIPFYPSKWEVVEKLSRIYVPRPSERIVDLGSGDARILITLASKYDDIKLLGIEKNSKLVNASRRRIQRLNLGNVEILNQDLFNYKISKEKIDTVYAYLTKDALLKLKPKLVKFIENNGLIILLDFNIPKLKPSITIPINTASGRYWLYIYGNKDRITQLKI